MVLKQLNSIISWLLLFSTTVNGWAWQPALAHSPVVAQQAAAAQTQSSTNVDVPKWLDAPILDGHCTDLAYSAGVSVTLTSPAGNAGLPAAMVHSGQDFYLCLSNMPGRTHQQVAVQIDSDHSRDNDPMPGDYQFSVDTSGVISVTEGNGNGSFAPIATEGVSVALAQPNAGIWNAELRISLEWFGGYARTDGLQLLFIDTTPQRLWPATSDPNSPATWGDLNLTPRYPANVQAGAAFVDGLGGYLVIPYTPALNPAEVTIEAWVQVQENSCGALIGNDQARSYWVALCQVLQFSHAGTETAHSGQRPLTNGWHHVAVSMDADGLRSYYVDGALDTEFGWKPEQEEDGATDAPAQLGVSAKMLRIGSDRTAQSADSSLHAYIQDLRIWNRIRTAAEIRAGAFQPPNPQESGLVAWWPFTTGLQDVAGGHDAGLIGNAGLARASRDVTSFPEPPQLDPYDYPAAEAPPTWDAQIPHPTEPMTITLDGVCRPAEYAAATKIGLEPNHALAMDVVLGADSFYLCTNILFGRPSPNDSVTLLINRDGRGGQMLGAADLRVRLTPDGQVDVSNGQANGFSPVSPVAGAAADALVASKIISGTTFDFQEDIYPVAEAWWAAEVRIPYSTLAPFQPEEALHFALKYDGTVSAAAPATLPWPQLLHGSWPAAFDENSPDTWGVANGAAHALYLPFITSGGAPAASTVADNTTTRETGAAELVALSPDMINNHVASPTAADFDDACPDWATPSYAFSSGAKWPRVDAATHPIVRGEGILDDIHVSAEDSPWIHDSHDVDMAMTPDADSAWLMLQGKTSQILETESAGLPIYARPLPGDHVTAIGRWIFDCGHAAKTEIHPIPIFESDSLTVQPVRLPKVGTPTPPLQEVRTVRIWMNSSPGAFNYTFGGVYTFKVQMPGGAKYYGDGRVHPFLHFVTGDASKVSAALSGSEVTLTVTPPAAKGAWYWEMTLGWLDQQYGPFYVSNLFKVHLDQLDVLDDHDHGFPDCGFASDCGEWSMTASVNHKGQQVFWNTTVEEDDDPLNLNLAPYDAVRDLQLTVEGYDDDDPVKGDFITSGTWNLGALASLCCGSTKTFQPGSDWKLFYRVTQDGVIPRPQADTAFWTPRWVDEANDEAPYATTALGVLTVPAQGQPALSTTHSAFVSEQPLTHDNTRLLGKDTDRYHFTMNDFADVTYGNLPAGLQLQVESKDPWYNWGVPANIVALVGYKGAIVKVVSTNGAAGDQAYTMQVNRTFRTLPLDWGEAQDAPASGRLVDLVTPEAGTDVTPPHFETPATRQRTKDWAWQHVANDVDDYDITIPPVITRPRGQPACEYDVQGGLLIQAQGARLRIPAKGLDANHALALTNLNAQFPDGHVKVQVEKLVGEGRGVYQLRATWNDGLFFNADECAFHRALHALLDRVAGTKAGPSISLWESGRGPDLVNPPPYEQVLDLYQLGTYQSMRLEYGDALDVNIAGQADTPVVARLYDKDGILLAESQVLDETATQQAPVPAGLEPQGHLKATGLTTGGNYLLQFTALTPAQQGGAQPTKVGVQVVVQP
ncbi:MAG: LamG domain-containing protein [Caldilineaceae bacterium]